MNYRKLPQWLVFLSFLVVFPAFSATLVEFGSEEGIQRLERSKAKADFFRLANHYQSQPDALTCGPTSAAIVLNAFRLGSDKAPQTAFDAKRDGGYLPVDAKTKQRFDPRFRKYTVDSFHTPATDKVKTRAELYGKPMKPAAQTAGAGAPAKPASDYGLQLHQLAGMLEAHGLAVTKKVVDGTAGEEAIRKELAENLKNPGDFVLVNYARKSLDQKGGGHISPLGAYDEKSDSFLVLDTNPNTASWVWVTTKDLVAAMNTKDTIENRGYLVVREGN